jgi:acyl-CoA synthetase (AMP-forming)/AMP-acid ligase II
MLERAIDLLGPRVWQMYGLTEAVPIACMTPTDLADALSRGDDRSRSVGRIMPFAEARIAPSESELGTTITGLAVGEIVVRCDSSSARAALGDSEGLPDDGWVATGDAGAIGNDGYLFLAGRMQDAISTRLGVIWPATVESVLLGVAGVRSAAVVAKRGGLNGQQVPAAVCVVDAAADVEQTLKLLRMACCEPTSGWWDKVGAEVVVRYENLPLTPAGKIDRLGVASALAGLSDAPQRPSL